MIFRHLALLLRWLEKNPRIFSQMDDLPRDRIRKQSPRKQTKVTGGTTSS